MTQSVGEHSCRSCGCTLRSAARFCPTCGAGRDAEQPVLRKLASEQHGKANDGAATWERVRPLLWLYGVYLATALVLGFSHRFGISATTSLWFQGLDAAVTLGFCIAYYPDIRPSLLLHLPGIRAVGVFLLTSAVYIVVASVAFWLLSQMGVPFASMTESYVSEQVPVWLIYVSFSVLPAIWEELAFRGVIQTRLSTVLTAKEAWLVQAGLFSVLHLSPVIFVTHFAMGLVFGWLRERSGSIYPGMLLHGCWNALVIAGELKGIVVLG